MLDKRVGRQEPTLSVVLPYSHSLGEEACELYNRSRRKTMPWQELMLEDIMAVDENGLWVHMKFGWSIPRRNGKSEILIARAIWGITHGRRVLYTAHRTTTSSSAWERCVAQLSGAGYVEDVDFKTYKTRGTERIEWLRDNSGAIINFRTRSAKGGLGEGYDDLMIDEAQEYTADQESALKYVVTSSPNPQTLMCGTPPTAVSSGTVFQKYRQNTLTGKNTNSGWAEWSVPKLSDAYDPELWYLTNPSLGYILSERTIRDELGDDQVDDNIQRLGLWLAYSQKSAISLKEWESYIIEKPELRTPTKLFYGVKYAKTTSNVSLSVAVRTSDNRIFVEAVDCRPTRDGNSWIIAYLLANSAEKVAIDGAGNQNILENEMKDAGVKCKAILPKVSDVIEANTLFEGQLFGGQICHSGQPALTQAVSNCEHRAIGSSGGYGYTSILEGADVSLVESVSLAHWLCSSTKPEKKEQIIKY
ncbi:MAG: terminase [Ruminococcus sp.]|nr:terminase [Ruminococcus sp.]